jgi:hypothetical protein
MPDVIRHPAPAWIPASAGMTKPDMFNCRSNNAKTEHWPCICSRHSGASSAVGLIRNRPKYIDFTPTPSSCRLDIVPHVYVNSFFPLRRHPVQHDILVAESFNSNPCSPIQTDRQQISGHRNGIHSRCNSITPCSNTGVSLALLWKRVERCRCDTQGPLLIPRHLLGS